MIENNTDYGASSVLFISNVPSPYCVSYLNELGKLLPVTAVFEKGFSSERNETWKNLNITNFNCVILNGVSTGVDAAFSPRVITYIMQYRKSTIIISNPATPTGITSILFCKITGIPYVLQSEGGIPKDGKGVKEKLKYFLMHSAKYYLSGMSIKNEYFLRYGATPERVFHYPFTSIYEKEIASSVLTVMEKRNARERLGIYAECMVIFVGQFIHRKAVDILLNACPGLPKGTYVLIVGGVPTEEYLQIIDKLGLQNVHFMNFIDKKKLIEYYLASDFLVLPTREDTWGLVVNEAMAQGLPVITTTKCVAGIELIEDGKNGFLLEVDDVRSLSDRMTCLASNPVLRAEMGQNNLNKIATYTFENMAKVIADSVSSKSRIN